MRRGIGMQLIEYFASFSSLKFAPPPDGRPAADNRVLMRNRRCPAMGNQRSEIFLEGAERNEVGIGKEAGKERTDFSCSSGAAHVQEHDGRTRFSR